MKPRYRDGDSLISDQLAMGNDRQQKVRRPLGIVIDLMRDRLAATDVVRNVLHVGHRSCSRRDIHACDLETDAMASLEQVGGRQDLDPVFVGLTRSHWHDRGSRQLVKGSARFGSLFVNRPI